MNARRSTCRRGAVGIGIVAMLVVLELVIVVVAVAGASHHDLASRRVGTVRAFYAGEAGMAMALREVVLDSDEDSDGVIGGVSSDGDPDNDPEFSHAFVSVGAALAGSELTLTSLGRSGEAEREHELVMQYE